jgi:site-specific DNA recombinase
VKRQLEDCRKLAATRGWTVRGEYVDNDVSAWSGKRRPEYERMVTDLRDGLVDAVIVYNLDRLTRRPVELEEFIAVCEQVSVRDVATVTADIDLGTDDGLFMARIFAAFGAKESGRRSARIKRKMEQNAQAGLPHGGSTRPFGYADDMVTIVPAEAAIIRTLAKRFLAGESLRSLATWLDDTGVKTVTGQPWRTPTLRTMLASGRIAGLREFRGEIVATAQWKPIITPRQRELILALMDSRKVSGRRSPRRYLLSGMLRCGKCGTRLYSSARAETRRYVCLNGPDHDGCGRLTITAQPVEELIAEAVLLRLDTPELANALAGRAASDEHSAALAEQVADDKARLEELAAAYGNRQITMPELLAARTPIEARIRDGERQLAHVTGTPLLTELAGAGKRLRRQWATLNLARQAAIVAAVLDHAVIEPGTHRGSRFDIDRVRPVWRL